MTGHHNPAPAPGPVFLNPERDTLSGLDTDLRTLGRVLHRPGTGDPDTATRAIDRMTAELAGLRARVGTGHNPDGAPVYTTAPGSAVRFGYASQCELDRSRRLARGRQAIAAASACPPWPELDDRERELATVEARNWLRAGIAAGIIAPCPIGGHDQAAATGAPS